METILFTFLILLLAGCFIGCIYLIPKHKIRLKDNPSRPRPVINPAPQRSKIVRNDVFQSVDEQFIAQNNVKEDINLLNTIITAEIISIETSSPSIDDSSSIDTTLSSDSSSFDFGGGNFGGGGAGGDF